MEADDSYGTRKRIAFLSEVIRETEATTVLDVGCGTGNQLTKPLAERFPGIVFRGVDSDEATIECAQEANALPNLTFNLDVAGTYDLIIASEVLEHVDDPVDFLLSLRSLLTSESSCIVVTVPNGFGPFEVAAAAERIMHGKILGGVSRSTSHALRRVKHRVFGPPDLEAARAQANTFADSPHVNFFSRSDVATVAGAAGFAIERQRSRTLVCGYGFDRVVRGRLAAWNLTLADALPSLCSGWMFVLRQGHTKPGAYVPGRWATWKRKHNSSPSTVGHGHDRLTT